MVYKSYDDIQILALKSALDIKIFLYIRDKFTYQRIENSLSARQIAKEFDTSPSKVTTLIRKLIELKFLKRVDRGIYRMNPFMFIPYKANAELLQKEWKELEENEMETDKMAKGNSGTR